MRGNRAVWVLFGALAFYWLTVGAIGVDRARDATDIISMVVSSALVLRLAHHALDRFLRGGERPEWRVTIGMTLFWASVFVTAAWGFAVRFYGRPQWMIDSPLNGFFRYWTLGAGLLMLSALVEVQEPNDTQRFILWVVIFGLGVLTGAVGLRFLGI